MSKIIRDETGKDTKRIEMNTRDNDAEVYDAYISDYQHAIEISTVVGELNLQKEDFILDAGCGTGRLTYKLIEAGCKVVVLDFSQKSLDVCKQRCSVLDNSKNIYFIKADVCNLPLKECIFDKSISSEVFEHIQPENERLKMLQELNRVLKFDGELLLTTFNYNLRKIIGRKREIKSQHLYFYRYDYFSLKKIMGTVFTGKMKICGIINLRHWMPVSLLNRYASSFIVIDKFIEKTPISYLMAHLLLVKCNKIKHPDKP